MPHVYNSILQGLEAEGVRMIEKTVPRRAGASGPAWGGSGIWPQGAGAVRKQE